MIQKIIYQSFHIECDKCGKSVDINVPYKYNSSNKNQDIYIKDRLEKIENLCNCDGIYKKFIESYNNMNLNYIIKH